MSALDRDGGPRRRCTGPLVLGVPDVVVEQLGSDERVVWLDENHPLLTPLDRLPWWSERFFRDLRLDGATEARYLDWEAVADRGLTTVEFSPHQRRWPQLWVAEVPAEMNREWEAAATALARVAGKDARHVQLLDGEDAVEEHYALPVRVQNPSAVPFSPRSIWTELVAAGRAFESDPDGPSLLSSPSPAEIDELWELYRSSMSVLSVGHPIESVLDRTEFERFAHHHDDCALALRSSGRPISLALLATDLTRFDWLDERWFSQFLQPTLPASLALIPGIVTKMDRQSLGLIDDLLALIPRMIEHSQSELTVLFPCNNLSRRYTPGIAQRGCDRFNPRCSGAVEKVASYAFRAVIAG